MGLTGEAALRLAAFFGVFALMAAWEALAPRRPRAFARRSRWPANLGVVVAGTLLVRAALPISVVGVAALASARGWGLFNWTAAPPWLAIAGSLVALDFVVWAQHLAFHRAPWLWRLHRMHHADLDYDVTTGVRFHPLEILISAFIKMAAVAALGAPAAGVVAFEIVLNALAMFNHVNASLPAPLDRIVRLLLVTPDMHRVHHSVDPAETHSNFGFNLSIWDRLFGLYRAAPSAGQQGMTIGLPVFRDAAELRLDHMLTQPWRGRV